METRNICIQVDDPQLNVYTDLVASKFEKDSLKEIQIDGVFYPVTWLGKSNKFREASSYKISCSSGELTFHC